MASYVDGLPSKVKVAIRRIFAISVVGNLCRRHIANMQSYCVTVGNIKQTHKHVVRWMRAVGIVPNGLAMRSADDRKLTYRCC